MPCKPSVALGSTLISSAVLFPRLAGGFLSSDVDDSGSATGRKRNSFKRRAADDGILR